MAEQPKAFLPSDYYRVRLEHTLKHTQESTRLIYLVNGGALGALYFAAGLEALKPPYRGYMVVGVLSVLALINLVHALLIMRQGQWYAAIDERFAIKSQTSKVDRPTGFPYLGTHHLYSLIHAIVTLALLAAAVTSWCAFK